MWDVGGRVLGYVGTLNCLHGGHVMHLSSDSEKPWPLHGTHGSARDVNEARHYETEAETKGFETKAETET